jgi:enoyl-CoA hydratase
MFSSRCLKGLVEVAYHGSGSRIAIVTLNSPKTLNAMTVDMGTEFVQVVGGLSKEPGLRAVVLTGAGGAFSAGGDIKFLRSRISDSFEGNVVAMRQFYSRFLSVRELGVPVVAGINGHAIGAGFCVALACDVRVVSESAKLAINFTRLGIHPGMGGTYFLPKLAGFNTASHLILTGDTISGNDALRMGLVQGVYKGADVRDQAIAIAEKIASASRIAVKESLKTLRAGDEVELPAALQREAEAQAVCYAEGVDLNEALNALMEKRSPKFL